MPNKILINNNGKIIVNNTGKWLVKESATGYTVSFNFTLNNIQNATNIWVADGDAVHAGGEYTIVYNKTSDFSTTLTIPNITITSGYMSFGHETAASSKYIYDETYTGGITEVFREDAILCSITGNGTVSALLKFDDD